MGPHPDCYVCVALWFASWWPCPVRRGFRCPGDTLTAQTLFSCGGEGLVDLGDCFRGEDRPTALPGVFSEDDPLSPLHVIADATKHGGDAFHIYTAEARVPPSPPGELHAWVASFAGRGIEPSFKIVSFAVSATGTVATDVRVELRATDGSHGCLGEVQRWSVHWRPSDPPRIERLQRLAVDRTTSARPLFSDRTASLIGDLAADPTLRLGDEYWYGRIDDLGEPNLMGHHGVAVGDVNGDGLEDLYVAAGTGLPNRLLIRRADGRLEDRAPTAGVAWLDDTKGVLIVDTDNDGDRDLVLAMGPTLVLAVNDGSGVFERFVRMKAPSSAPFYSISAADYDLDGDLDLYGVRYVEQSYGVSVPVPFHDANNGPSNHLMRNDGGNRFVDVTHEVGLDYHNRRFSLIGAWADYDADGDPDLYVANDFGRNNLYRNDGGRFVDVAAEAGVEDQAAGMGADWADFDADGDLDLHVTNM